MSDDIVDHVISDNAEPTSSYTSDQKIYHQTLQTAYHQRVQAVHYQTLETPYYKKTSVSSLLELPGILSPERASSLPTGRMSRWTLQPVWMFWRRLKSLSPYENRTLIPQSASPQPILLYWIQGEARQPSVTRTYASTHSGWCTVARKHFLWKEN
jgi:hypothetical protein